MADRWVDDDGGESSRRRERGPAVPSSSQSASGARRPAPSAQQQARASRDPRTDPRASTSPSQSQQTSAMASGSRYLHETQRGESSGYRTGRTRASVQEDDSSEPSDDESDDDDDDEDDEAENDGEDNYEDRNIQSTTSRQQRSDSIMTTSEGAGALQQQARAAVQRLTAQGYREDQAVALVREELRKKLGGNQNISASDNNQSGSGTGTGEEDSALRARLPGAFQGHLAWKGQDLSRACEVIKLGSSDINAIQSAVVRFKATGGTPGNITRQNFRLSSELESKLRAASREIHQGRGFVTLRGLDKAGFDDDSTQDGTIAFTGIAAHVCPDKAVSRFSGLNLAMEHIYDARGVAAGQGGPELPSTKLPTMLRFHADRFNGDVLAMYVRHPGNDNEGQQYVASFATIYNQLLRESPRTLLALGRADWPFMIKHSSNLAPQALPGPVIFFNGSNIPICQLVLEPLLGEPLIPRPGGAAAISQEQREAIELVQRLATQNQYELGRQKGDIQFINNLGILHARNKYNDDGSSRRHLQRMFLRDPQYAWPKPAAWAAYFDNPFRGPSSGALVDHWDQHPRIAVFFHG